MLCLTGKLSAGIQHPFVRKSLIEAAQDDFQVFPAQTHLTLAHRTALHGNFRKEFDKKQQSWRQRRSNKRTKVSRMSPVSGTIAQRCLFMAILLCMLL